MAPDLARLVRRVTFALLAIAAVAVEIAAVDVRAVFQSIGLASCWVGVALVLTWFIPVPADPREKPPRSIFLLMLALAVSPFVVEPFRRSLTGEGSAFELQMVFALRNVGLGLAACGGWLLCTRLACVVSLFLMLFSVAMTNHPAVLTLLGLYTATGSVWLMLVYWSGLRRFFVTGERAVTVEVQGQRDRLPWVSLFMVLAMVGCVLGIIVVGPGRVAWTLGELFPTSGGTGEFDPFARGGVNDGDDETQGDNAKSTGMTQTESFLESPLPSLYDVVNDMSGEPFKTKTQERMIALAATNKMQAMKNRPADNLRPNRDFPTTRKSPKQRPDPLSRSARAIFEVQGRTPLHIRVTAFDAFDGWKWDEAPMHANYAVLDKEEASNWMKLVERSPSPIFAESVSHQFKLTAPTGSLIPTPPHLTRFRVGRVDQVSFFNWAQERVLRLADRKTPSGIIVETESRTVDPRLLPAIEFPIGMHGERFEYTTLPPHLDLAVIALAKEWTDQMPEGWIQIASVVRHLRSEYIHDREYVLPEEVGDPTSHFLLRSKRGPDYQFATACAILLRTLGHPTRLVNGFYAHPDHYDPETRHTPIVKEDLHFWVEVMLPSGDWLVIEPTPGYDVPGPSLPLSERVWNAVLGVLRWGRNYIVEIAFVAIFTGVLFVRRRQIIDTIAVRWWRWFPGRTWREQVRNVMRLLERRGRWGGHGRAFGQTFSTWLVALAPTDSELQRFALVAEWASYGPESSPPWDSEEVRVLCHRVIEQRKWCS